MRRSLTLLGVAVSLISAEARAQAPRLEGVVVDETGAPVEGAPVLLHRLSDVGGGAVGTDTTAVDGSFAFPLEDAGEAVHFAAVRDPAGTLFVGPIFNGTEAPEEYRIVVREGAPAGAVIMADGSVLPPVGGGGVPATPAAPPAATPDPPSAVVTAALFLLVFTGLAGGVLWMRARWRRSERRQLLVELAGLEERRGPGESLQPDERAAYERERASLRERLRDLPA